VARDYSPVGPVVRGSGHRRDTRADHPFAGYKLLDMPVHTQSGCDILSRTLVRVAEFFDSIALIERLLDDTPSGRF